MVGYLLLEQYKSNALLPPGDFWIQDLQHQPNSAGVGFDDFGSRYQFVYFTAADRAAGPG